MAGQRRLRAESAIAIEHRQGGQADAHVARSGQDTQRHGRDIVVGPAIGIVVEILEFGHAGVSGLEHLYIELRRDGLQVVRLHAFEVVIHRRAPGPEAVGVVAGAFGETGHGPLVGMRVQIGHARQHTAGDAFTRRRIHVDLGDRAGLVDAHGHVFGPSMRQECAIE